VQKQKTLDNMRESDETVVAPNDEEILADESIDEFSQYFNGEVEPKIIITSCYAPTKVMYEFIRDLLFVFPNSFYYKRMKFSIKQITEAAKKRGYTDLLIINEDKKTFNGLTHVHLPEGPTSYYKLSNVVLCKDIEGQQTADDRRAHASTGGCACIRGVCARMGSCADELPLLLLRCCLDASASRVCCSSQVTVVRPRTSRR
jgi:hypothetical protein